MKLKEVKGISRLIYSFIAMYTFLFIILLADEKYFGGLLMILAGVVVWYLLLLPLIILALMFLGCVYAKQKLGRNYFIGYVLIMIIPFSYLIWMYNYKFYMIYWLITPLIVVSVYAYFLSKKVKMIDLKWLASYLFAVKILGIWLFYVLANGVL